MVGMLASLLRCLIIHVSVWVTLCSAPGSVAHLRLAASIETSGNAGFEAFQIDGRSYLAAANFWDGDSDDMSADSKVYEISASTGQSESSTESSASQPLVLTQTQSFRTQGAKGWDYFEVPATDEGGSARQFLVVPNFYGCGNSAADAKTNCKSTVIYEWQHAESKFVKFQKLATNGPGQTDHFLLPDGRTFIVVGENFGNQVCIYQLLAKKAPDSSETTESKLKFKKVQCLPCPSAGGIALARIGEALFLVAASYQDPQTSWRTRSLIYRLADGSETDQASTATKLRHGFEGFVPFQEFNTHGAHDAEFASIAGQHFLFMSEDRSDVTSKVASKLFVFNGSDGQQKFDLMQKIPTDGAYGAEFFEFEGTAWLAVANFGDRLGGRYSALSSLWRYDSNAAKFKKVTEVQTQGATDWEHFVLGGEHYLAVSNEGKLSFKEFQTSHIYQLTMGTPDAKSGSKDEL